MSLNLKYIFLLPLIFLFLPALYAPLGTLTPVYLIIIAFFTLLLFLTKPLSMTKVFIDLYKHTPFRFFVYFLLWCLLSLSLLLLIGKLSLSHFLYAVVVYLFAYFLLYYIYPAFCSCKLIVPEKLYKFLIISLYLVFVWGIIAFLGAKFNINIISTIQSHLSNRQLLAGREDYINLVRARSTLFEPGFYGYFISLNLPLIYGFAFSKYRLLKNKINYLIKKTICPLVWLNLILTLSPIGIIFGIVVTLIYFRKSILNKIFSGKYIIHNTIFIIIIAIFMLAIFNFAKQSSQLQRILSVILNMHNIESLNIYEPSLYTRIVSYTNSFILFLKNPILGVGLGEAKYIINNQFLHSPLVLSIENTGCLRESFIRGKMVFNRNILCDILSETGLIGALIFYFYLYKTIKSLKKCTKILSGINKEFTVSIMQVVITMTFLSFYEVSIVAASYHFFIFALANAIVLKILKLKVLKTNRIKNFKNKENTLE